MKSVFITGASRGIGKATTEKFLKEGWEVIGTSTNGEGWENNNLLWIQLDLSDLRSIEQSANTLAEHGPIDVLINNAGIWPDEEERSGVAISMSTLRKVLEVNLIGTIDLTERLLAANLIKKGGHIISMGSMAGAITGKVGDFVPSYKISKVGLSMYTRTLAVRLNDKDITVSILDPGWVSTDMGGAEAPRLPEEPANEYFELVTKKVPTGRFWREGKERSW